MVLFKSYQFPMEDHRSRYSVTPGVGRPIANWKMQVYNAVFKTPSCRLIFAKQIETKYLKESS